MVIIGSKIGMRILIGFGLGFKFDSGIRLRSTIGIGIRI